MTADTLAHATRNFHDALDDFRHVMAREMDFNAAMSFWHLCRQLEADVSILANHAARHAESLTKKGRT